MASLPVRDPLDDQLLTPQNVALVLIDYQDAQIMGSLCPEVCLAFPVLEAMRDGFEVYPVADAVAGTSPVAHEWALQRMVQVGAHPVGWISVMCELQRDWNRTATAQGMIKIALGRGGSLGTELAVKLDRTTVAA
jgi:nicotinamidase-related amidase